MPNHPLCPPHNLPPTPCEGFFYCPDPLALTDEQLDALFPREQRIAFIRDVYRRPVRTTQASISPATNNSRNGAHAVAEQAVSHA